MILKSILEPFGYIGIPLLFKVFNNDGEWMPREDVVKIKQACNDMMNDFKHLDLTKAAGPTFIRHALGQVAIGNGAQWAKCNIRKDLSGDSRAFLEYGRFGGKKQLYSVPLTKPTP